MKIYFTYILSILLLMTQCVEENNDIPKPKGYFRIDFPAQSYSVLEDDCPFVFEKPDIKAESNKRKTIIPNEIPISKENVFKISNVAHKGKIVTDSNLVSY